MSQRPPSQRLALRGRRRGGPHAWFAVTLVLLLVCSTVGTVAAAAPAASPSTTAVTSDSTTVDASLTRAQQTPVQNNSSVRHRNPEAVASENRLSDLQRLLGSRLSERLSSSAVELNQEQYERAQSVLGEEYLAQLSKYGEVVDERDDEQGERVVDAYNQTRERQREYTETVQDFRETQAEYQEAQANGNDSRARELARELVALGDEASRQSEGLNESYSSLGEVSGTDLSTAQTEIQQVQADIDQDVERVETAEFVATELVIRDADETGSFTQPLGVSGTLESERGLVSNQEITLEIGEQTTTVETNADGNFFISYRPTTVLVNRSQLDITYRPAETSPYRQSNATIPVSLSAESATVDVETATTEAGFGTPVRVTGSVTAAGVPVTNLSLAVVADGTRLGTVRTNDAGAFAFEEPLPATPRPGDRQLVVEDALSGRAVTVDTVSRPLTVSETATTLDVQLIREGDAFGLQGQLRADGQPVPNQQLSVSVAGDRLGTTRTDAEGRFSIPVDEGEANQTATVTFDGDGTNLQSTSATVELLALEVTEPPPTPQPTSTPAVGLLLLLRQELTVELLLSFLTTPVGLVVSGVGLGALGLLVTLWRRRRRDAVAAAAAAQATTAESPADADVSPSSREPVAPRSDIPASLSDEAPDEAVIGAYGAVRAALVRQLPTSRARTHWQFFEACVAQGIDDDSLRTLTESYELARYGAQSVSDSVAETALAAARSLTGSASDDGDGGGDGNVPAD